MWKQPLWAKVLIFHPSAEPSSKKEGFCSPPSLIACFRALYMAVLGMIK